MKIKPAINIFLMLSLFYIILTTSCDDTPNITNIDNIIFPSSNVSYSEHVQLLFNAKCINCHGDQTVEGGLSLTSWSNTTQNYQVVAPGLPQNSKLVWSIEGTSGNIMPPLGSPYTPVTKNHIDGIKTWIKEGAKNN